MADFIDIKLPGAYTLGLVGSWFRRTKRMSVSALARELGVHRNTLAAWEADRQVPNLRQALAWSKALTGSTTALLDHPVYIPQRR